MKHGKTYTYFVRNREVPYDEWALDDDEARTRGWELAKDLDRSVFVYQGQRHVATATVNR